VTSANWQLDRGGRIDFDNPKARTVRDGLEPIQI
jgi:hypothetical protein